MITRGDARGFLIRCGFISKPLYLMDIRRGYIVMAELGRIKTGHYAGYFILAIHHEHVPLFEATPAAMWEHAKDGIRDKNGKIITAWQSHKRYNIMFAIPKQRKLMKGLQ